MHGYWRSGKTVGMFTFYIAVLRETGFDSFCWAAWIKTSIHIKSFE
ncbi:hypothetical protein FM109_09625 [Vibrio casei]|nr:hypothetical protein FM109_09625 [Vibrio casei]